MKFPAATPAGGLVRMGLKHGVNREKVESRRTRIRVWVGDVNVLRESVSREFSGVVAI